MLSGALGCLISGMAYADGSSPQPVKPYWQDIQVVAVNKVKTQKLLHELCGPRNQPSPLDLRKARTIPY